MTREEAIEELERLLRHWDLIDEGIYDLSEHDKDAVDIALAALRPVSREQVEKVWRGCEKCNGAGEYSRYAENLTKILLAKYCPHCGRPLTDEAVDMMLRRWKEVVGSGGDEDEQGGGGCGAGGDRKSVV